MTGRDTHHDSKRKTHNDEKSKKSMGYDRNMKRCCFKERLEEKRKMVIIVVFSEFFSILSDGVHHGDIIFTHTKSNECALWGPLLGLKISQQCSDWCPSA